jgi:predicted ArsR family transcriptional regulator
VLRHADVLALLDEDALRRRPALLELTHGARQRFEGDPAGTMGDLLILLQPKSAPGERLLVLYEIANRCKAEHLRRKPAGMVYFTDRQSMAETIRAVKGQDTRVILLPDIYRRPEWLVGGNRTPPKRLPAVTQFSERSLLPRQRSVLAKLDLLTAASAEAIAAMLGQDRTGICRVLNQLVKVGLLTTEDVRVDVLHGPGAPTKLYRRASTGVEAVRHLLLSWAVVLLAQRGFHAVSFDATTGILEVAHEEAVSEQRALLWLDGGLPFKRVMEEVRELQRRATGEGAAAQLFTASDERVDDLRKMLSGGPPAINISTAWRSFRQKSAEVREAADADVRRKRGKARKARRRPSANSGGEAARASAA